MKKNLRYVLAAAAATAMLYSVPTMAAGWVTNSNGYQVYQNDDGSTVTNSWIKATDNGNTVWYYATNDGTLRTDGWQKVGGYYYYFDGSGVMQTGWVDDNNYYCDENSGVMKTGWKQLTPPDDFVPDSDSKYVAGEAYWFYFNTSSGEKFHSTDGDVKVKSIDGVYYGFDQYGIMQTGWAATENGGSSIGDYMYFAEKTDGKFKLGQRLSSTWYSVEGPEDSSNSDLSTGSVEWYYFKSNGHPAAGTDTYGDVQKVNGKRYLFNAQGNPLYGIQMDSEGDYYYCGTSKTDCSVRTGKLTVTEDDGDKFAAYFGTNGKGVTGAKSGYAYYKGKLQAADSDNKYMIISGSDDSSIEGKVVDTNGKILKSKTSLKDKNGVRFSLDASGNITYKESGEKLETLTVSTLEVTDNE